MSAIAGTAFLSVDGQRYALVGEFEYMPSNPKREAKMGMDGFHGTKESPMQGRIKAKIRDGGALSVQALGQMVDVTVVAELINGKTVIGRNMFVAGDEPPSANAEEGEISIVWEGPDVTEQLGA